MNGECPVFVSKANDRGLKRHMGRVCFCEKYGGSECAVHPSKRNGFRRTLQLTHFQVLVPRIAISIVQQAVAPYLQT